MKNVDTLALDSYYNKKLRLNVNESYKIRFMRKHVQEREKNFYLTIFRRPFFSGKGRYNHLNVLDDSPLKRILRINV